MNHPMMPSPELSGPPRIPPPPAGGGKRRQGADPRVYACAGAFVVGAVLGFVAYRFLQGFEVFDYLVALVF